MVIDFHIHIFPDILAQKTIPLLEERSSLHAHSNGTAAMTLKKMAESGITYGVIQNIATNPRQMKNVNNFAIETNKRHELVAFGSVHPLAEDIEYELDRLMDAGITGIKLHPDYQEFFINDPAMQPIYEAILKRGFVLLFHTGLDLGLPYPVHAAPEAIAQTISLFSGEKVVFAHMAGFQMAEKALEYIIGKNIYIDTSCSTGYTEKNLLLTMLKTHNPDKILFATDFPWGDFAPEVAAIRNLGLSEEQTEKILYKNAARLLEIASL